MFRPSLSGALLACAMMTLPACDRLTDKGAGDKIASAEKKASAGDFRAACTLYEDALDGTAKTADVHYRLALIYGDKLKDPLDALHHLHRYVELVPTGSQAKDAKNLIKDYENKLLVQLTRGAPANVEDAVRLKNENQMLLEKLAALRAQKAATPIPASPGAKPGEAQKKPIPPGSRTYTVQAGDTLAKISRQYYKTSARAQDIQDANFNQLNGTVKIKPGMVLIIPK
jgi:hypothetical protein